jgi:hypothetical protein
LIIADPTLPLACVDDFDIDGDVSVAVSVAQAPLLANLCKASIDA